MKPLQPFQRNKMLMYIFKIICISKHEFETLFLFKAKKTYAQELYEQMVEQEARKKALKQEKILEQQLEAQNFQVYDPFGRGGAGAPMRNVNTGTKIIIIIFLLSPPIKVRQWRI